MGGDGGSIHGRQEMVQVKKNEKRHREEEYNSTCFLSQNPLEDPVVYCGLGYLYNKEAVLLYLLDRKRDPQLGKSSFAHIKSTKDIHACSISWSPSSHQIQCPITLLEGLHTHQFLVSRECGCVYSQKALEQLSSPGKCVCCGKELKKPPLPLLPNEQTRELLKARLAKKRRKKEKKMQFMDTVEKSK